MTVSQQAYLSEEVARRGNEIYEQNIKAQVEAAHRGKVVAIDILTGDFAIGGNALDASERLRARRPDAEVFFVRVGHQVFHRIGMAGRR